MKKFTLLFALLACAVGYGQTTQVSSELLRSAIETAQVSTTIQYLAPATATSAELVEGAQQQTGQVIVTKGNFNGRSFHGNSGMRNAPVLAYESGPYFSVPGPPDISLLEDVTLGMNILGFGTQASAGNRGAEDIILADDYDITSIDFFGYQTGAPTAPASIDNINVQIWDGDPSVGGSTVIWGDDVTNVLDNSVWSNAYRESESNPGTARAIQRVTVLTPGLSLTAGTYWVDWQYDGDAGFSGPWQPPVVELGNSTTGNGKLFQGGGWLDAVDSGTATNLGLPIQVYGDCTSCGGAPCTETNPSNAFENAFFSGGPTAPMQIIAADVTVAADEVFNLMTVNANLWGSPAATVTSADIVIYGDAGGVVDPGTVISSQLGVVPVNQTFLGTSFGFDVLDVEFDIADVMLNGQAGIPTTYWVSIFLTMSDAGDGLWESSSATIVGNPTGFSGDGGVTWNINPPTEQVYTYSGECSPLVVDPCTTYAAAGLPLDIDPGGTSTADCVGAPNLYPATVGGAGTIGTGAGEFTLDNVALDITHTWAGDLEIYLVSPAGTELILSDNNGGSGDDYIGTIFQDGGADITAGSPPFTGTFAPQGGTFAATFAGESITGDWDLKICDTAGGDTGTVDTYSITFCANPSNDLCADAFPVACDDVVVGTTTGFTDTGGNPAPDVWYSFTGTGTIQ
ncbi:MAG: hypothetical protein HKO54_07600, partial [Flavobacteriaceae bacterium]|nr:hypothetical protein [Flavobacteriaceae bacterium]